MELHALQRPVPVPEAHDLVALPGPLVERGPGGLDQAVGQRLARDDQRVIAGRLERVVDAPEHAFAGVVNHRGLAVHHRTRADHLAAERLTDGLMTEAYAENRHL